MKKINSNKLRDQALSGAWVFSSCLAVACGATGGEADTGSEGTRPFFPPSAEATAPPPVAPGASDDGRIVMNAAPGGDFEGDVKDGANEVVSKGFLQRTRDGNAEIFQWSTGGGNVPDVPMRPTNSHICALTRIGGNFNGLSGVVVHHNNTDTDTRCRAGGKPMVVATTEDDTGPTWKLGGCQRQGNSLTAEATCVAGTNFNTDPGGIITGSEAFHTVAHTSCSGSHTTPMWPGIAVSFLNAMVGRFEGGGEVVSVIPASSPSTNALLSAKNRFCDAADVGVDTWGYSMFASVPDGQHTTLRSFQTAISSNNGPKSKRLATTKEALCYLVRVSGQYDGAEERVRIAPQIDPTFNTEWWTLTVHAGGGDAYATAECVRYNQSTLAPP